MSEPDARDELGRLRAQLAGRWRGGALLLILALSLLAWTLFVGPSLVEGVERLTDRGAFIEYVLRVHFAYATWLVLLGLLYGLWARPVADRRVRLLLGALAAEAVVVLGVWTLDRAALFRNEGSAVTFFTALTLVGAALAALANGITRASRPQVDRAAGLFWGLLCVAFLAAGIDEYFTVHEWIGARLEPTATRLGWPEELVQDGVTALYALGAVGFVVLFSRCFRAELLGRGQVAGGLLLLGIGLYGLAVVNDSLDVLVEWALPGANPEHLMNFTEELLELTAANLFLVAFLTAFLEHHAAAVDALVPEPRPAPWRRRALGRALVAALLLSLAAGLAMRMALPPRGMVVEPEARFEISVLADASDGLHGIDEIVYVEGLGLLVGNEETGEIVRIDPAGEASVFLGPADGLASPDGLAFGRGILYVVDEESARVLRFDASGQAQGELAGDWKSPEGVAAAADGSVYVADEAGRIVTRVRGPETTLVASALDGLVAPEQLALDPERGDLYVSDQSIPAVFRITPDGGVTRFLDTSHGLDSPESLAFHASHLYVVDANRAAVLRFDREGRGGPLLSFARQPRDLAGITLDPSGTLYLAIGSEYGPHNRILRVRELGARDGRETPR